MAGSTDIFTSIDTKRCSFLRPGHFNHGVFPQSLGAKDYVGASVELVFFLHVDAVRAI